MSFLRNLIRSSNTQLNWPDFEKPQLFDYTYFICNFKASNYKAFMIKVFEGLGIIYIVASVLGIAFSVNSKNI